MGKNETQKRVAQSNMYFSFDLPTLDYTISQETDYMRSNLFIPNCSCHSAY